MEAPIYFDRKNYDPSLPVIHRKAMRAIIRHGDKYAMVLSRKYNFVNIPGGGVENHENDREGLARELMEETGLKLTDEPMTLMYTTIERRKDRKEEKIFEHESLYYSVDINGDFGVITPQGSEKDEDILPVWMPLEEALKLNKKALETIDGDFLKRDTLIIEKLMREPIEVVAALIRQDDSFLICRRPAHKKRGLLWEFVGGKTEPGETSEDALIREVREELDVTLSVGSVFFSVVHEYPDITINLKLFNASIKEGTPKLIEHCEIKWITPNEIDAHEFCPADTEILKKIKADFIK